jgi:hypothetical protein
MKHLSRLSTARIPQTGITVVTHLSRHSRATPGPGACVRPRCAARTHRRDRTLHCALRCPRETCASALERRVAAGHCAQGAAEELRKPAAAAPAADACAEAAAHLLPDTLPSTPRLSGESLRQSIPLCVCPGCALRSCCGLWPSLQPWLWCPRRTRKGRARCAHAKCARNRPKLHSR